MPARCLLRARSVFAALTHRVTTARAFPHPRRKLQAKKMKILINIDVPVLGAAIEFYCAALPLSLTRTIDGDVAERKSVVQDKSVSDSVDPGGSRTIINKNI